MPRFQIVGTTAINGRTRMRIYEAESAAHAREFADVDGTIVRASMELPSANVREGLVAAARQRGIPVPNDISDLELSDLICFHTWRDRTTPKRLQNVASEHGVLVTQYAGEGLLCQKLFDQLKQSNDEKQLAIWFTYQVYRNLVCDDAEPEADSPDDPVIRAVARILIASPGYVKSILSEYYGADLICFGEWTDSAGIKRQGGSKSTLAYRQAEELLGMLAIPAERTCIQKKPSIFRNRAVRGLSRVVKDLSVRLQSQFRSPKITANSKNIHPAALSYNVIYSCVILTCLLIGWLSLNQ